MSPLPLRTLRARLGQLSQPPEFRIPRPLLTPAQSEWLTAVLAEAEAEAETEAETEAGIAAVATADVGATARAQGAAGTGTHADGPGADVLLRAATGIWRALRKLEQRGEALSAADARQVRRHIEASRRSLAEDGLEIQEHDGAPFDPNQSLEALVFQDSPGLTRETVLETVRPTVYFRGRRIQTGQVIVGRPGSDDDR